MSYFILCLQVAETALDDFLGELDEQILGCSVTKFCPKVNYVRQVDL